MRLLMIGTGYVGLVSGVCFAKLGAKVTCLDVDEDKIEKLKNAISPIYEANLEDYLQQVLAEKNIEFVSSYPEDYSQYDAIFLAVGTPSIAETGAVELKYLEAALTKIAENLNKDIPIIIKSTVPVKTGAKMQKFLRENSAVKDVEFVSNPEFLREGLAVEDFLNPDRVIIGVETSKHVDLLRQIYADFSKRDIDILVLSRESAEITKYASNSFLAAKISFINEIANLCENTGANIDHVAEGMGLDSRIGEKFLKTGPGFGGSCFPKDTLGLKKMGQDFGAPQGLTEQVIQSNIKRQQMLAERIADIAAKNNYSSIALLGLAFKAGTDDLRDSPAVSILNNLVQLDDKVKVNFYDPHANLETSNVRLNKCSSIEECLSEAKFVVIATEWPEFTNIDFVQYGVETIYDMRNLLDAQQFQNSSVNLLQIGKKQQGSAHIDLKIKNNYLMGHSN